LSFAELPAISPGTEVEVMGELQQSKPEMFWGEVTPCEHLVQIYENDDVFLDTLEGFAAGGLRAGEGVIVIATGSHLEALEDRLRVGGIDVDGALGSDQYIPANAEELIDRLVYRGWPDDYLFKQSVTQLLVRARGEGRKVRAFGEMVALLWAKGQNGATVRLEHLWNGILESEALSLFCAYPRSGFTQHANTSIQEICAMHTRVC
jgi:hypothetical protein